MTEIELLRRELDETRGYVMYLMGALAAQMKDREDREIVTARTRTLAAWAQVQLLGSGSPQAVSDGVVSATLFLRDPKRFWPPPEVLPDISPPPQETP